MSPPCFGDLGKEARDLFSKGFHNGLVKLDVKTVTDNKIEFKLSGSHTQASGKTDGKLEGKLPVFKDYGVTVTETWDTKNILGCKLEMEDQLLKGLKLTLDSTFNASTGGKDGSLKINHKHENVNLSLSSGLQLGPPVINLATVFGCPSEKYQGFLVGADIHFDTGKRALSKSQLAIGYSGEDFKGHTHIKDLSEFGGTLYHKVNSDTEVGIQLGWTGGTAATRFGLAAKHKLDSASHVNMAVDNKSNVQLGLTTSVRPGVKVTFSGCLDGKAISGGDHKVGLGLDLDLS